MFLKINHLFFLYFLASWNFFHGKKFLLSNKKIPRSGEATSDRCEGEMCLPCNIMFRFYFAVDRRLLRFCCFSGVHTKHGIFGNYVYPSIEKLSLETNCLPASRRHLRVRACVLVRKYFKFAHTYAPCVQLEIYQAYEKHSLFSQLPFSLRLSYSSIRFFRLLIYYVPKKNCYRWSIFNFFWISNTKHELSRNMFNPRLF